MNYRRLVLYSAIPALFFLFTVGAGSSLLQSICGSGLGGLGCTVKGTFFVLFPSSALIAIIIGNRLSKRLALQGSHVFWFTVVSALWAACLAIIGGLALQAMGF